MYETVMCTPHSVEVGVGNLATDAYIYQATVPNSTACNNDVPFLMKSEDCHTETHGFTDSRFISCVLAHRRYHNEMREYISKAQRLPLRGCPDDKPPRKAALLAAAFALSLQSRPTELKAPTYGDGKPDVPVCVPRDSAKQ
jgi:hypothetical protein